MLCRREENWLGSAPGLVEERSEEAQYSQGTDGDCSPLDHGRMGWL